MKYAHRFQTNRQGFWLKKHDREGMAYKVENTGATRDHQALVAITTRAEIMSLAQGSEVLRQRNKKRLAKSERRKEKSERVAIFPWSLGSFDSAKQAIEAKFLDDMKKNEARKANKKARVTTNERSS